MYTGRNACRLICLHKPIAIVKSGAVIHDIAISAEGLGFDYPASQIRHNVANGSSSLRCFVRAVLPRRKAAEMDLLFLAASAQYREYNKDLILTCNERYFDEGRTPVTDLYVTGSIHGWSRLYLTYIPGGC